MLKGISGIMPSSSSSSSSSSSATKIKDLINELNTKPIYSFIIGISHIKYHSLNRNIAHAALLFTTQKKKDIMSGKCNNTEGILLEYGSYPPDEPKAKIQEEENIKNDLVIYRYGDKGGLRYYTNTIDFFRNNFCDVGYVTVNICKNNQKTFFNLIDILAPLSENKWIKENYNAVSLIKNSQNCQDFVCHVIDILKPTYEVGYITKGNKSSAIDEENKEDLIPSDILKTLKKYETDD